MLSITNKRYREQKRKMTENKSDFESCKKMIYKLVDRKYHKMKFKRPDVQFDDLMSEGFLIYSMCLANYKGDKSAKFTTYLYTNLVGRLDDYYHCTMKKIVHYEDFNLNDSDDEERFENQLVSNYDLNNSDLLVCAKENLSYEAYKVFEFIVSCKWQNAGNRSNPSDAVIAKAIGLPRIVVSSVMGEIKQFWNKTGYAVA